MSYQVIARKWRPQTFDEVTGQEIITHTLRNALEHDRLHHAYLFSGSRGVGKTTTARLLAKSLNCHKTDSPNLTPCTSSAGEMCASCLEITEGRSLDVLEIDAASHTGIDNVRETIIESISFNPARDRYKVFIIDEVHQLSKAAFNALLKTLEEPPSNVVFVMATTEKHKVPDTILSRCQEFQFRTIPLQKIFDRLRLIADAEKIEIPDEALREIARSGEGSMRDAQSNFDQVISFSGDKITPADVAKSLGFAGIDLLTRVVRAITDKQPREMLVVVDELVSLGHDLRSFCSDMLGLFRDLMVFKVAGDASAEFETDVLSADEMRVLSEGLNEADLLRFFNSLAETESRLKEASHARYVLEVGLVKLIEMNRVHPVEELLKRLDSIGNGSSQPATAEKKTLNAAPPVESPQTPEPEPVKADPPVAVEPEAPDIPAEPEYFEPEIDVPDDEPPDEDVEAMEIAEPAVSVTPVSPLGFDVSDMPVRLPPISSEELEHYDDTRLDRLYEEKLEGSGDAMTPIPNAVKLVDGLLGGVVSAQAPKSNARNTSSSGAAAAPAFAIPEMIADHDEDLPASIPQLTENPTEQELMAYAESHPDVRRALKILRGKIVGVEHVPSKSGTPNGRNS